MNDFIDWWNRMGLQLKLQLLIQGLLLIILLGSQHWLMHRLEAMELEAAHERATTTADGVNNGLNTLMDLKVGGKDVISDEAARALFIERIGVSDNLKEVRVIRGKGTTDEYGPGLAKEQLVDEMDSRVLSNGKPEFEVIHGANGDVFMRAVLPSIAYKEYRASKCLECHGVDEGTVLGAISVKLDIKEHMDSISRVKVGIWVGQGILQVLLFFVIGFIVRHSLAQLGAEPTEVTRLARDVAKGDLSQIISLQANDSHSMMAQLKHMQQSLADIVAQVLRRSASVATASVEIAQGNNDLSVRTEHQANSLMQITTAMNELDATVKQNADNLTMRKMPTNWPEAPRRWQHRVATWCHKW